MSIYETIAKEMSKKDVTEYKTAKDCSLKQANFYSWKENKSKPSADALLKLADYFKVSVDYLLGRTEVREVNGTAPAMQTIEVYSFDTEIAKLPETQQRELRNIIDDMTRAYQKTVNRNV